MFLYLVSFVFLCAFDSYNIDEGWRGFKPFHTEKATVDRVLGRSVMIGEVDHRYSDGEVVIDVRYSGEPCTNLPYGRGMYNLPENTVLDYIVRPKEVDGVRLADLRIDRSKYKRETDGEIAMAATYTSESKAIHITTLRFKDEEFVHSIAFRSSREDTAKFKCK